MAKLTKTQFNAIQTVVINRSPRTKFSSNWQKVFNQFAIGEPDGAGKYLYFSGKDHDLLREMALLDTGFDVQNVNFNQPRKTLAAQGIKEKYANIRPDANYVLVQIPLQCSPPFTTQYSLRMTVEQAVTICADAQLQYLIVVENLDSFDDIGHFSFDTKLAAVFQQAMVVYRGSGPHSPAGCKRLLHTIAQNDALHSRLKVVAFTDLDPAGVQIAHLLQGCGYLIAPDLVHLSIQALLKLNDTDDFDKQWRQQQYLQHAELHQWRNLVNCLQQYRISLKQQHMLAHQLPLTLMPLHC
ncbi:DUF7281 domain-containing protein [Shewanella subflava]|uniref:DUF7281 domain-containing protein n=1 Tax=Shewanella subflava TaxID=2986476 RepID=A0ABT3I769_9GAMM|nr:hypothetical protein [Shewanella subflava]MCW3171819.1 hypothetical protein [Shewanella subflava]